MKKDQPDLMYARNGQRWDQWTPPIKHSPFHRMVGGEWKEPEMVKDIIIFCGAYLTTDNGELPSQHWDNHLGWVRLWSPPYILTEEF